MQRFRVLLTIAILLSVACTFAATQPKVVQAHGDTEVGPYVLVFGWRVEPAYVGIYNGPELSISLHDDPQQNIAGAENTLKLEVSFGGVTKHLKLKPMWGKPGSYTADLIPTRAGDYMFKLTGKIGETDVDVVFDSADGEFSSIEPVGDILFPDSNDNLASLRAEIEALKTEVEKLKRN